MSSTGQFPRIAGRMMTRLRSRAAWIAASYAVFATLWILFSDHALSWLAPNPETLVQWSVFKGLAFVTVTSLLLLLLIRRAFGAMETGYSLLQEQHAEIERLNRIYAALSHVNQAIVWAPARDALLKKVCQVLVEHGRFSMVWIGWNDPETHMLVPVAECGDENGYLRNIKISTEDQPQGRGPTGTAFREGRPYICNDFFADPATLPWREEATRRGIRGSAVFPIRLKDKVCGVLNVYANEPNFFQDKEISLLVEASADISFGLDNFTRDEERQKAEAGVKSEKLFSDTMIESMPGIIYFYDERGGFLRWNSNFETVSGYSGDQIARMNPLEFFAPADQPLIRERIAEVFTKGESAVEAPFVARNGRATPYFFTGRSVLYEGKPCLLGMGIDLSERKSAELALQQSEHRYRTALDTILEGCQLISFDWRYLYLNDAAAMHNRRPNAELIGRAIPEAWPGIEQTRVFTLLQQCLKERVPVQEEVAFSFADGTTGWFEIRILPIEEGILLLSIETTQRKQAELTLRVLNQTLELQVIERTAELQAALVRAEAADRIKSAFLATMSHELRTPLNSIIGFTGIVLQGLAGPLNPEQTKQLGMVRGSARHLLELINDVLDISKIEAGQLEVRAEPFDLPALIQRGIATVKLLAEKKGLILTAHVPTQLNEMVSDQRRVEQILLNLLNNAIKFTDQGQVTVSVDVSADFQPSPEKPRGPGVRLRVTDTGIGIKPEHLTLLFQPFRQLDSGLTRQHEGTGLGLAICRRLAALLGGEIQARSDWQRGSEFTVILPLHPL